MEKEERDLDDSKMFSNELLESSEEFASVMKKFIDGEEKNVNPLAEIPTPQMRLYGFSSVFKSAYFDTKEELTEYVRTHNTQFGNICIMDYLGHVAGCKDVIRLTYKNGRQVLYTPVDEDGYGVYNYNRSVYRGEFIWEYNYGNIREMYSAFRDRGITFEDDIYAKIDESNRKIMTMFRENTQQILTKKRKQNKK